MMDKEEQTWMFKIATDSTCDLPAEFFQQHDVAVVPINVSLAPRATWTA